MQNMNLSKKSISEEKVTLFCASDFLFLRHFLLIKKLNAAKKLIETRCSGGSGSWVW